MLITEPETQTPHRKPVAFVLCSLLLVLTLWTPSTTLAATANDALQQALNSIDEANYSLAISYLDAIVIDPRITAKQRSRAYYFRGFSYYAQGLYVSASQDYLRALEFDSGNSSALESLAELYNTGKGLSKDATRAFELNLRAARGGRIGAMVQTGIALLSGQGTAADLEKARYWLMLAAQQDNTDAMLYLAQSYRRPYVEQIKSKEKPNPKLARQWYQRAIDLGSVDALTGLGFMYQNSEFSDPASGQAEHASDVKQALHYFTEAAEQGSALAQVRLAHMYLSGIGVAQSDHLARSWFQRAANQEYSPAYLGLGYLYQSGRGVAKNPLQARQWFLKGAQQGNADCQLRLAEDLLTDAGLANTREAITWFRAAAEQGSNSAANSLAWLLATSRYDELRNAEQALLFAQQASNSDPSASILDTLAAAEAEAGNFSAAVDIQQRAIEKLSQKPSSMDDSNEVQRGLKAELERHLASYQQNKPWRE